jgi:hypothetical protein
MQCRLSGYPISVWNLIVQLRQRLSVRISKRWLFGVQFNLKATEFCANCSQDSYLVVQFVAIYIKPGTFSIAQCGPIAVGGNFR